MTSKLTVTAPAGVPFIDSVREFDAPRELVFRAWSQPDLLVRWLGPRRLRMTIDRWESNRDGGAYRYVWSGPGEFRLGLRGVYREIEPPVRLVYTEAFEESWYAGEALNTVTMSEQAGVTTVTMTSLFESQEGRDMALRSGMEKGVAAGYDALDAILAAHDVRTEAVR